MLNFNIKLNEKSRDFLDGMPKRLTLGLRAGLREAMKRASLASKEGFADSGPVRPPPGPLVNRTRRLSSSITHGVRDNIGWIGTMVSYGITHELLGVGSNKGIRPFLRPALSGDNLDNASSTIREAIWRKFNE